MRVGNRPASYGLQKFVDNCKMKLQNRLDSKMKKKCLKKYLDNYRFSCYDCRDNDRQGHCYCIRNHMALTIRTLGLRRCAVDNFDA